MIIIEDNDTPILAAGKLIHGTRPYNPTVAQKVVIKALCGEDTEAGTEDMFDLEEIKELADYLMIYYNSHERGD